jgi:hypothetical protein
MLAICASVCLRAVDRACPANLDDHRVSPANPLLQRCQPFKRDVRQRTLWTAASASSNCLVPIT